MRENVSKGHTPGPWEVDEDKRDGGADQIIAGGQTITFMATGWPEEQRHGNAHLIAAAPDLLGALINLIEWVTLDMVEMQREGHTVSHLAKSCDLGRAAIAKAKG